MVLLIYILAIFGRNQSHTGMEYNQLLLFVNLFLKFFANLYGPAAQNLHQTLTEIRNARYEIHNNTSAQSAEAGKKNA